MAETVFTNAYVLINSVDLSDHVKEVRLNYQADVVEYAPMGSTFHKRLAGLLDWSVSITFNQDYASGKVDATMFSIVGTSVAIELRPVNTTVGPTNPKYTGNVIVQDYQPMGGAVGDLHTSSATLIGNASLTRGTS